MSAACSKGDGESAGSVDGRVPSRDAGHSGAADALRGVDSRSSDVMRGADAKDARDATDASDAKDTSDAKDASAAKDAQDAKPDASDGATIDARAEASPPPHLVAYGGGYESDLFVYSVSGTTGALTVTQSLPAFGTSPSFLAVNPALTRLYAVNEQTSGQVGAYSMDPSSGVLSFLNAVSSGGSGPPFVSVDATGGWVFVANYGDGSVSVLKVKEDGSLAAPSTTLTAGTKAHMIVADPSNHFVFVPCLGADYIAQFTFNATTGALSPNPAGAHVATATGAGPRHIAFHPNGHFAYVINETNSTLVTYEFDEANGTLAAKQTVSTLPAGFSGSNTAAEVHVHPSGAWLLASNRGADDLAIFVVDATTGKLSAPAFTPSGGMTPRDFTIAPGGSFVYVANQGTGNIVPFTFDAAHGTLAATAIPVDVMMASFIGVVALP